MFLEINTTIWTLLLFDLKSLDTKARVEPPSLIIDKLTPKMTKRTRDTQLTKEDLE